MALGEIEAKELELLAARAEQGKGLPTGDRERYVELLQRKEGKGPRRTNKELAQMYGLAVRGIESLRTAGRKAREETPLDDPEAMVGWWKRNRRQRVPDYILRASLAGQKKEQRKAEPAPKEELPELPELPVMDANATGDQLAEIYTQVAQSLGQRMLQAVQLNQMERATELQAMVNAASHQARQWAQNLGRIREQADAFVSREAVVSAWGNMAGAIPRALFPDMVAELKAAGVPDEEKIARRVLDRAFAGLAQSLPAELQPPTGPVLTLTAA